MKLIYLDKNEKDYKFKEVKEIRLNEGKIEYKINIFFKPLGGWEYIWEDNKELLRKITDYKNMVGFCSEYNGELYCISKYDETNKDLYITNVVKNYYSAIDTRTGEDFVNNVLKLYNFNIVKA